MGGNQIAAIIIIKKLIQRIHKIAYLLCMEWHTHIYSTI